MAFEIYRGYAIGQYLTGPNKGLWYVATEFGDTIHLAETDIAAHDFVDARKKAAFNAQ